MKFDERDSYTPPPSFDGGNNNNSTDSNEENLYQKLSRILTRFVKGFFAKKNILHYLDECVENIVGNTIVHVMIQREKTVIHNIVNYSITAANNEFLAHIKSCLICQNKTLSLTECDDPEEDRKTVNELLFLLAPSPTQVEELANSAVLLREFFKILSIKEKEFFIKFYVDGYDYKEISEMTGEELPALRKRKSRIIDKLENFLTDREHLSQEAA